MEVLEGTVKRIIYRSEQSCYTVFSLADEADNRVTAVGTFFKIDVNEMFSLSGDYINDKKYGRQFKVDHYESTTPNNLKLLEKYLGNGIIHGIGKVRAKLIVSTFKEQTMEVLEKDPMRLSTLPGIGKRTAELIGRHIEERGEMQEVMLKLSKYGVTPNLGVKVYNFYKERTFHMLQSNPYDMIRTIPGVQFLTADKIAKENGIPMDSPYRIQNGVRFVLASAGKSGSCYLPYTKLVKDSAELMEVDEKQTEDAIGVLAGQKAVIVTRRKEEAAVYERYMFLKETECAGMIRTLTKEIKDYTVDRWLDASSTNLDDVQKNAVRCAARCGFMCLTGGPGTGKTTTINLILDYFESRGLEILLAAPTGRAAKRMCEATGREAKTIHRMLGIAHEERGMQFEHNEDNPLDCDLVVIDETSMIDLELLHSLLLAVPHESRVILVGDQNQLPSVGAGNVLADIIASGVCPVVRLTKIYRQSGDSEIITNAHRILNGQFPSLSNKDFFFKQCEDPEKIKELLIHYVADSLPGYTGESDIQVLSPLKGRTLGTNNLNLALQERLNPDGEEACGFRVGDKVIQLKNNYDKEVKYPKYTSMGVFNGDMGRVSKIDRVDEYIYVTFEDGGTVQYEFKDLSELSLAYALTVHKSQGSEYPVVVIPIYDYVPMLMTMNLIYTAVTRAKKCILLIGSPKKLATMIRNKDSKWNTRYTGLAEELSTD